MARYEVRLDVRAWITGSVVVEAKGEVLAVDKALAQVREELNQEAYERLPAGVYAPLTDVRLGVHVGEGGVELYLAEVTKEPDRT